MKIIYLLPPSEGKNTGGVLGDESLHFSFQKPYSIAKNATEKDLKCQGTRYQQGIMLNAQIKQSEKLSAIERYSGVMYKAIDYVGMDKSSQEYFNKNFYILSGMYGVVKAQDMIGNYKLPIETKGLYSFWGDTITSALENLQADYIVNMLPGAYSKMIDFTKISSTIVQIDFMHTKDGILKKMTHGVKKVKGEYIYNISQNKLQKIEDFPGVIILNDKKNIHIQVVTS